MCSTGHGGNGILFIGRGLAYRKTEETDLLRSKRGPVDREGCGVPPNGGNGLVLERYGRNGGPVHREGCGIPQNGTPWDTVHLHRRLPPRATIHPPSTTSRFHLRLFIHGLLFIQPPPLLHRLLFSQPSPQGHAQPPLHGLLFIQPSTGYCSTSPPRGHPVHPALHGVLFIHPQPARSGSCSSSGNGLYYHGSCSSNPPPGTVHPKPPTTLTVHPEAASIGFS